MSKLDGAVSCSVIIPAWNASGTIEACIRAVASQDSVPCPFEILVVDDGSSDATPDLVERLQMELMHPLRLIRQSNAGPAAARNLGAREARGRILVFTDSDCFPDPDWLEKLLAPFTDETVAGTKGTYRTEQEALTARFVQIEYESKYRRMARFDTIDFIDTYSAAFRKDVFDSLGGFDTGFPKASVEDQEFSFRAAAAGHRMVYVPGAIVRHLHVDSLGGYIRKKFKIGYFKSLLLKKHPGKSRGDSHTPKSQMLQIGLVLLLPLMILGGALGLVSFLWAGGLAVLFFATMIPFCIRAFRRDPIIGLLSPAMLAFRAMALGAGLVLGAIRLGKNHTKPKDHEKHDQD